MIMTPKLSVALESIFSAGSICTILHSKVLPPIQENFLTVGEMVPGPKNGLLIALLANIS